MIINQKTQSARTVYLHLLDGRPDGKIEVKLDNWVGEILRGGRSDLNWLLSHEKAKQSGIYLLQGNDPDLVDETKKRIYVGLSDRDLESRLRQHAKNETMDFWETACLITASDETMNPNNCSYVEAMLIKQARDSGRANIQNKQHPASPKISSIERQPANNFICQLKIILPIINIDFLNPLQAKLESIKGYMFEIYHTASKVKAWANEINKDFFVLKGSQATAKTTGGKVTYQAIRQELINKGDLEEDKSIEGYVFTKDVKFSSASAAASVIINRHAGPREWKIRGKKEKDYSYWRENPEEYKDYFAS